MLKQFIAHVSQQHLFPTGREVLLAVSGGIDSVVLAHLMHSAGYPFAIAHCNFHLRPGDCDRDEAFVCSLARDYGVDIHVAQFQTNDYARTHGLSVEDAARQLRYQWFATLCRDHGYPALLTAHHRDDAGETFFLNRGGSYDENGYYNNSQYDQQVSIDFAHRRMLVGSRKSGTRYLWVFDLDEALSLPLEEMQITVNVGTPEYEGMPVTEVTRKIMGRDLGKCKALGQITVPVGKNKDTDVYSYSHQGHEIYGNYIYFYEGNAVEDENFPDTFQGVGYMTMFNYIGDVVVPRTKIQAMSETDIQKSLGITQSGYVEPESFKVKDGEIYLGFSSRDDASSLRKANILRYEVSEL